MALILFLIVTIAIAYLEAFEDALKIAVNKSINHRDELIERCMAVACAGLLLCGVFSRWEWRTLLWIPAAWGAFTIAFRAVLNRKRGKDWRYVSPSNWYDRQWIKMLANDELHSWPEWNIIYIRAGAIAYAFEFAIMLASIILYAWAG